MTTIPPPLPLRDHVIVCGAGSTGGYIIAELIAANQHVVAIDTSELELQELAARHPPDLLRTIAGDATDEAILARAALATARGVVTALANDKDNIYIIVETRQINPTARIVARASEQASIDKIRRIGADSVVSPAYIGSMRLVSEMLRPTVVRFLDDMLRDTRATYRIEEATVGAGSELDGATLAAAQIRQRFQLSVLALGRDGTWTYNPDAAEQLTAGTTLVVLGDVRQVAALRAAARGRSALGVA